MAAEPRKKRAAPRKKAAAKKKASAKKKAVTKKKATVKKRAPAKKKATAKRRSPRVAGKVPANSEKLSFRSYIFRGLKYLIITGVVLFLLSLAWVGIYVKVNPPGTLLMMSRFFSEGISTQYTWCDLEEMSLEMPLAVLAAEDQRFPTHSGFDFKEIEAALETRQAGGRLRGASTLSQQTAKNAFLWNGRSWIRKGLEVYFTLMIEQVWGKRRILEVYLNIAEMGEGIYGVEAAAQHYYNKSAKELSREECAALAAVLPNPRERSPIHPSARVVQRKAWILKHMHNLGGVKFLKPLGIGAA